MHRAVTLALALAAAAAFSACGGSSNANTTDSASSTTSSSNSGSANRDDVQSCLKGHGVDLPDNADQGDGGPPGGFDPSQGNGGPPEGFDPSQGGTPPSLPGGVDAEKLQDAMKACGVEGNGGFPGAGNAENQQAFEAYASCMKDHGVDVPTPGANPSDGSTPSTVDRTSQAFTDANEVCKALLPADSTATSSTTAG